MASMDSGDAEDEMDDEAAAEGNAGSEGGADAEAGGEAGSELSVDGSEANEEGEGNETEATPFFNDEMEEAAPMSLSKGDTLPLSYRSDNGTRESEFYFDGDDKENINPYYDVVRRLSPTELIGRFMRTSSPRVSD